MKKILCLLVIAASLFLSCNYTPTQEINSKSTGIWEIRSTVYFPEFNDSIEIKNYWDRKIPTVRLNDTLSFAIVQDKNGISWKLFQKNYSVTTEHVIKTYKSIVRHLYQESDNDF